MSETIIHSTIPQKDGHLYEHQIEAKRNILNSWDNNDSVLLQMPTGTGKTYLFSSLIEDLVSYHYKNKMSIHVLIVAHRIELIHQISDSLKRLKLPHGIIQGDHLQCWHYDVQVGSIQSLLSDRNIEKIKKFGFNYIVVDEAHHSLAKSYKDLFSMFPSAKKLGVTATPWRLNHEPFPPLYSALVTTPQVSYFIHNGRLSDYDYVSIKPTSEIQKMIEDISVSSTGDYVNEELDRTFNIQGIRAKLYESYEKYAQGRKGIIYAINKKHASNIASLYSSKGVKAAAIDCDTPKDERDRLVRDFKDGRLKVLVNVEIFTEGFDCPDASFIQLARPTKSLALYLQQVGRGLRVHKDKDKTIILDNVGLYNYFGLPSANRQWHRHFNGLEADESPSLYQLAQASRTREVSLEENDEAMVLVHHSEAKQTDSTEKSTQPEYKCSEESEYGLYSIPNLLSMKTKSEIVLFLTKGYQIIHPKAKYWEIDKMLMRQFNLNKHAVRSVITVEDLDDFTLNDEEHLSLVKDILWDSEDTYFILTNQFDECPLSMVENYANQFAVHVVPESLSSIQKIYPDFPSLISDNDTKDQIVEDYENARLEELANKYKHPTNEIRSIIEDDTTYRVLRMLFGFESLNSIESLKEFSQGSTSDFLLKYTYKNRLHSWYEEHKKLEELSSEEQEKYELENLTKNNRKLADSLLLKYSNALIEIWSNARNKKDIFVYLLMIVDLFDSNSHVAEYIINLDDIINNKFEEAKLKFLPTENSSINADKAILELDKTLLLTIIGRDKHYHCVFNDEFIFLLKDRFCRHIIAQSILLIANHPAYIMHDAVHCDKTIDIYRIEQSVDDSKPGFNIHQYSKKFEISRYIYHLKHLVGGPYLLSSSSIFTNITIGNHADVLKVINELTKSSEYVKFKKENGIPAKLDSTNCLNLSVCNKSSRQITYMVTQDEDGSPCGCQTRPCLRDVWISILQKLEITRHTHIKWVENEPDPSKPKPRRKLTEEEKLEKKKKEHDRVLKKFREQIITLSPPFQGKILLDKKGNYYCGDYFIPRELMSQNNWHYFDQLSVEEIAPIKIRLEGFKKEVIKGEIIQ